jgi:hypothetical protein
MDEKMKFSFSSLSKYENCNGRWYRYKVLGQQEPPTEAMVFGKAVHDAIKYILADKIPKDEAIARAVGEAPMPLDPSELDKLIGSHVMAFQNFQSLQPRQVERHFELKLSDEEDAPVIHGYIDLDLDIGIIDWKTNWKTYEPTDNHQLGLYAWAKSRETGAKEVTGQLFFLRYPRELNHGHVYSEAEMEQSRQWAYNLAREIESKLLSIAFEEDTPENLFPDTPGPHCTGCGYACECYQQYEQAQKNKNTEEKPAEPTTTKQEQQIQNRAKHRPANHQNQQKTEQPAETNPVIPDPPKNRDEAVSLAKEIFRLEEVLTSYKELLKAWVEEHGPVQVGDQEFGFKESISYQFAPEKVKEFAQHILNKGINPWKYLAPGASQLAKLKKEGITEAEIEQFAETKTTRSFRKYKAEKKEGAA